ncbi:hypothetical protein DFH06DRAFT_1332644 [Mycena polygramma]|nr:hypothetical protein DFH06DRAFT_1332644 [Mycena polygramma]
MQALQIGQLSHFPLIYIDLPYDGFRLSVFRVIPLGMTVNDEEVLRLDILTMHIAFELSLGSGISLHSIILHEHWSGILMRKPAHSIQPVSGGVAFHPISEFYAFGLFSNKSQHMLAYIGMDGRVMEMVQVLRDSRWALAPTDMYPIGRVLNTMKRHHYALPCRESIQIAAPMKIVHTVIRIMQGVLEVAVGCRLVVGSFVVNLPRGNWVGQGLGSLPSRDCGKVGRTAGVVLRFTEIISLPVRDHSAPEDGVFFIHDFEPELKLQCEYVHAGKKSAGKYSLYGSGRSILLDGSCLAKRKEGACVQPSGPVQPLEIVVTRASKSMTWLWMGPTPLLDLPFAQKEAILAFMAADFGRAIMERP